MLPVRLARPLLLVTTAVALTSGAFAVRPEPAAAAGVVRGYVDAVHLTPTGVSAVGWALRTGSAAHLGVRVYLDGVSVGTGVADTYRSDVAAALHTDPWHGYRLGLLRSVPAGTHRVCVRAAGVLVGCRSAVTQVPPGRPAALTAAPSTPAGTAVVHWTRPALQGSSAITAYVVTTAPTTRTWTVGGTTYGVRMGGLATGTRYSVRVVARNGSGTGAPAAVALTLPLPVAPTPTPTPVPTPTPAPTPAPTPTPSPSPSSSTSSPTTPVPSPTIPPQTTAAPVSTSHYLRQLTGTSTDVTAMRSLGAYDAPFNPSGHRYTALLDIGGQDETPGGVVLSATTRFLTYAQLVTALEAYLDGYASTQNPTAPMVVAVCTNNDIDVSSSAGRSWMVNVIAPLRTYAAKFPQLQVVGADDMEPGFSATVTQTRDWLSGYLAAGTAPFVFNGSADGCSATVTGSACNNGWHAADLAWLAGGAAPSRISVLPQIYNTTMPKQWAQISLTGLATAPALSFDGPLTEWTACYQTGGCSSLTGVTAWNALWSALRAYPAIAPAELADSTDLDIH